MTKRLLLYATLGFLLGLSMRVTTEAQTVANRMIFAAETTATGNASQAVQTSSNALKVLGK